MAGTFVEVQTYLNSDGISYPKNVQQINTDSVKIFKNLGPFKDPNDPKKIDDRYELLTGDIVTLAITDKKGLTNISSSKYEIPTYSINKSGLRTVATFGYSVFVLVGAQSEKMVQIKALILNKENQYIPQDFFEVWVAGKLICVTDKTGRDLIAKGGK